MRGGRKKGEYSNLVIRVEAKLPARANPAA